jgi:predicted metal-dependent phosphoesterase TrpH
MERALERGQKKEAMDPIMMDEEHTKEIMDRAGVTHNARPYQYKINRKKREVAEREGLDKDEEEVEDLHAT